MFTLIIIPSVIGYVFSGHWFGVSNAVIHPRFDCAKVEYRDDRNPGFKKYNSLFRHS